MNELGVIRAIPPYFSWAGYDEMRMYKIWYAGRMYEYPCSSGISLIQHGGVGGYKSNPTIHGTNCFTIGEQCDMVLWWQKGRDLLWIAAWDWWNLYITGKSLTLQITEIVLKLYHLYRFKSSKLWFHFRTVSYFYRTMISWLMCLQQDSRTWPVRWEWCYLTIYGRVLKIVSI